MEPVNKPLELQNLERKLEDFKEDTLRKIKRLKQDIEDARYMELVSAQVAANKTGIAESTIRQAGQRGTINKYNEDGSRKITNSNTAVFYNLLEIRNKINPRSKQS